MSTVPATIEEEIFYPAVRETADADDILDEADVEHASLKKLVAQIGAMNPDENFYDAKFTALRQYVNHHVKEKESDMCAKARKAKVDLKRLGAQLQTRKPALMQDSKTGLA